VSTKIFNGYRLRTGNFAEAHKIFSQFKVQAKALLQDRYNNVIARQCTRLIDARALGRPSKYRVGVSPLMTAWDIAAQEYRKIYSNTPGTRNPYYDFDVNFTIFPVEDQILITLYCEEGMNKEVVEAWKATEGIEYFGYWNNVDPDEDCSDEEWEERKRLWEIALGESGTPAVEGYSTEVMGLYGLLPAKSADILPLVEPRESRAVEWARDLLTDERFLAERDPEDEDSWFKLLWKIQGEVAKDKVALEFKTQEILPKLPEVTKEMLTEKFDDPA